MRKGRVGPGVLRDFFLRNRREVVVERKKGKASADKTVTVGSLMGDGEAYKKKSKVE